MIPKPIWHVVGVFTSLGSRFCHRKFFLPFVPFSANLLIKVALSISMLDSTMQLNQQWLSLNDY